jgi:tetratricopeptide (TPR) repeat protein
VSTVRFLVVICFSASWFSALLHAQYSSAQSFSVSGELRSHGDAGSSDFVVEVYDARNNAIIEREPVNQGQFKLDHVPAGSYSVRLVTAPGETPIVEEFHEFEPGGSPLVLDLPERVANEPISGLVSVHDLQHPVPKKAIQKAYEAQQLARANKVTKAIAKLEDAIRIDPEYRDAHLNLGVQYVRVGRTADARAEFQKALDIGPPAAPLYLDLALTSLALREYRDAGAFAHKALELDPANRGAQLAVQFASQH